MKMFKILNQNYLKILNVRHNTLKKKIKGGCLGNWKR